MGAKTIKPKRPPAQRPKASEPSTTPHLVGDQPNPDRPQCNAHGVYTTGIEELVVVATGAVTARVRLVCDPGLGATPWRAGHEVSGPGFGAYLAVSTVRPPCSTRAEALHGAIGRMRQILRHYGENGPGRSACDAARRALSALEEYELQDLRTEMAAVRGRRLSN